MPRAYAVLLIAFIATFAGAQGATKAQLEEDIATFETLLETRQQTLRDIELALGETSAALEARLNERNRLSGELAALRAEQGVLTADIGALRARIEATDLRIEEVDAHLNDLTARVQGLLLNLYKQPSSRFAGVVAQAESFHDLQVKNYYLSLLSEQDVSLINDLNVAVADLLALQETQQTQLTELTAKEVELSATETALEAKRSELDAIVAELEESREGQLALQRDTLNKQAELEQELAGLFSALEREEARLEAAREEERARAAVAARAEEAAAPATPTPTAAPARELPPLASGYVYPVDRPQLVSAYGVGSLPGVRLRGPEAGAAVHAVQPGFVVEAARVDANQGSVVAIQHAEGLYTVYLNLQTDMPVRTGDRVEQGQTIGYLGGGTLIPADQLVFLTAWVRGNATNYTDPAQLLGF